MNSVFASLDVQSWERWRPNAWFSLTSSLDLVVHVVISFGCFRFRRMFSAQIVSDRNHRMCEVIYTYNTKFIVGFPFSVKCCVLILLKYTQSNRTYLISCDWLHTRKRWRDFALNGNPPLCCRRPTIWGGGGGWWFTERKNNRFQSKLQ